MKKFFYYFLSWISSFFKKDEKKVIPAYNFESYFVDEFTNEILNGVNHLRTQSELPKLELRQDLCDIAFSHCLYLFENSDGRVVVNHDNYEFRVQQIHLIYGERGVAENVAGGLSTARSFVSGFKNSPKHNDSMMNPRNKYTGIAHIIGKNNRLYVVQIFVR